MAVGFVGPGLAALLLRVTGRRGFGLGLSRAPDGSGDSSTSLYKLPDGSLPSAGLPVLPPPEGEGLPSRMTWDHKCVSSSYQRMVLPGGAASTDVHQLIWAAFFTKDDLLKMPTVTLCCLLQAFLETSQKLASLVKTQFGRGFLAWVVIHCRG